MRGREGGFDGSTGLLGREKREIRLFSRGEASSFFFELKKKGMGKLKIGWGFGEKKGGKRGGAGSFRSLHLIPTSLTSNTLNTLLKTLSQLYFASKRDLGLGAAAYPVLLILLFFFSKGLYLVFGDLVSFFEGSKKVWEEAFSL